MKMDERSREVINKCQAVINKVAKMLDKNEIRVDGIEGLVVKGVGKISVVTCRQCGCLKEIKIKCRCCGYEGGC